MVNKSREAPGHDELEVSIFGPGVGECVVVHLGDGRWMVVDSCLSDRGRPIALEYLEELGVSPAEQVVLVGASHWHDDHCKGLADVVKATPTAAFWCSLALCKEEFTTLLAAGRRVMMESSGVDELFGSLRHLRNRARKGTQRGTVGPSWAIADRLLWRSTLSAGGEVAVWALSPSDADVTRALRGFEKLLPKEKQPRRRIPKQTPNAASVVMWIDVRTHRLLLGGDLETENHPGRGWEAVLASQRCGGGRASIFKVPHHGAYNAHHEGVWADLLEKHAIAAVTPYRRSKLPRVSDMRRLCEHTDQAFLTASPESSRSPRRSNAVERTMREVALARRPMTTTVGHVRVRAPLNASQNPDAVTVDLFEGARHVREELR